MKTNKIILAGLCLILIGLATAEITMQSDTTIDLPLTDREAIEKANIKNINVVELGCNNNRCSYLIMNEVNNTFLNKINQTIITKWNEALFSFDINTTQKTDTEIADVRDAITTKWLLLEARRLKDTERNESKIGDGKVSVR